MLSKEGRTWMPSSNVSEYRKEYYEGHKDIWRRFYSDNRDKIIEAAKRWAREFPEKSRENNKKSRRKHMARYLVHQKEYRAKNKEKVHAYSAVDWAKKTGRIEPLTKCELCDADGKRIEGHHADYNKPLERTPLCCKCHSAEKGK